jgi:hypothetical protein
MVRYLLYTTKPSAKKTLMAVSAHERASTMPRLHRAKPVAWDLLRWSKWLMMVERQGSRGNDTGKEGVCVLR